MTVLVRTSAHFECTETAKRGDIHMSAGFTLDFCDDYIWIRHPAGYCITPESQQRIWAAIGEARKAYDCPLVLEETPETPECSMSKQDAFKSAMQAASAARDLRMACLYPGYDADEVAEFFIKVAYNSGIRVEYFSSRDEALEWLGIEQSARIS